MKHKNMADFTKEEKNFMDTIAVNYVIAQSDGFQLGYARAIRDFNENIFDYWQGTDDNVQQSILCVLVDLGVELGKRKEVALKNINAAREMGYEKYYYWQARMNDNDIGSMTGVYIKKLGKTE